MNREQRGEALWGGISGALLEEHPRGPKRCTQYSTEGLPSKKDFRDPLCTF